MATSIELLVRANAAQAKAEIHQVNQELLEAQNQAAKTIIVKTNAKGATTAIRQYIDEYNRLITLTTTRGADGKLLGQTKQIVSNYAQMTKEAQRATAQTEKLAQAAQRANTAFVNSLSGTIREKYQSGEFSAERAARAQEQHNAFLSRSFDEVQIATERTMASMSAFSKLSDSAFVEYVNGATQAANSQTTLLSTIQRTTQQIAQIRASLAGGFGSTYSENGSPQTQAQWQSYYNSLLGVTAQQMGEINAETSMFGRISGTAFDGYTSGAISAEDASKDLNKGIANLGNTSRRSLIGVMALSQAVYAAFYAVVGALRSALTEMKNVDTQLVDVRKVTDASAEELAVFQKRAYDVGKAYGIVASDYLTAVAAMSRAGYREQAGDLAELSAKLQLVGNVSQDVANQLLISVDKAYKLNGNYAELSKVIDQLNEIDNKFATSIERVAEGMGIIAPVASQAHMSIEELASAIGTITATTQRSGSEAARAMRSLVLNIVGDTKTEIEDGVTWTIEEINTLKDVLKKYAPEAVKAAEATGEVINPMKAIGGLAQSYKDGLMTEQDLFAMVADIGGKLRSSQLMALIQNWDMYNEMLKVTAEAAGSADKEVQNALDSWQVKINQLKNTFTEFVSKSLTSDFVKGLLDFVTKLVADLGSIGNVITIIGGAIIAMKLPALIGTVGRIVQMVSLVGGGLGNLLLVMKNYGTLAPALAKSNNAMVASFNEMTAAEKSTQLATIGLSAALTAITIGITAAIIAYNKINQSQKEKAEASEKLAKATGEESKRIDELYQKYLDAKEGSEQQKKASEELRNALDLEADSVKNLSDKYKELTAEKRKQSTADYYDAVLDRENLLRRNLNPFTSIFGGKISKSSKINLNKMFNDPQSGAVVGDMLDVYAGDWNEIFAKYNKAESNAENLIGLYTDINALLEKMKVAREKGDSVPEQGFNILKNWATQSEEYVNAYEDSWKSYVQAKAYEDAWSDSTIKNIKTQEDFDAVLKKASQSEIKGYGDAMKVVLEQMFPQFATKTEDATKAVEEQAEAVDDFANKLKGATNAIKEYNKALEGGEKGDTFKSYAEAYKKAVEMYEKGMTGSTAYMSAIDLLFGSGVADTYEEAGELLGNKFVEAMFKGGGEDFGVNAANYIRTHLNEFKGVAIDEAEDGTFSLMVTSMEDFAKSANLSEDALTALLDALDVFHSDELDKTYKEVRELTEDKKIIQAKTEVDNSALQETQEMIHALDNSTIKINVDVSSIDSNRTKAGTKQSVAGKFASGTDSASGGLALVNEAGAELIYANGKAWIAGDGKPTITNIPKGAGVFTAGETKDILTRSGIPSFKVGTGFDLDRREKEYDPYHSDYLFARNIPNNPRTKDPNKNQKDLDGILEELSKYIDKILKKTKEALDKQLKAIDAQIEALEREHNATEEKNELEELQLKILEAEKKLAEAKNERTVRYFNSETGQWEWMADQKAVADAEKELQEAKDAYDKEVAEQAYKAQIQALNDIKDALQNQYNELSDHWDEILKAIKESGEEEIDFEKLIQSLGLGDDTTGSIRELILAIQDYERKLADGTYEIPLDDATTEKLLGQTGLNNSGANTLSQIIGMTSADTNARGTSLYSTSNSSVIGNTYYINGIKIGSDMMDKPLSQILSVLPIYAG